MHTHTHAVESVRATVEENYKQLRRIGDTTYKHCGAGGLKKRRREWWGGPHGGAAIKL